MVRLQQVYREKAVPSLLSEFSYRNHMQVPRLEKIVLSMGVGRAITEKKLLDGAARDLGQIAGQRPLRCKARKSVSNFKLREGMEVGLKVTLRGRRMYEFLDRLVSLAIPRVRDFRGLNPDAFDGRGNYSLGVVEQTVFPEVNIDKIEFVQGMDVTIRIIGGNEAASREMLTLLGFPFRRRAQSGKQAG